MPAIVTCGMSRIARIILAPRPVLRLRMTRLVGSPAALVGSQQAARSAHGALCGRQQRDGQVRRGRIAGIRRRGRPSRPGCTRAGTHTLRYDAPPGRARRARRCDAGRAGDGRRVFAGRRRRSEWARRTAWGTVSGSQLRSRCPCSLCVARKLCLPATPSSASRPRKRDVTACVGGRALRAVKKDADRRGVP